MEHSYYKDRVSAWIDQELPPYEQEALTQHIAECEECQALADKLRQAYRLVDGHSDIGGSDEYWEELARKTEARIGINQADNVTELSKARTGKSSGLVWKIAAVAASLVALTFIGLHRQDILQDIFNQETAPTEVQRAPRVSPHIDTTKMTGQGREDNEITSPATEQPEAETSKEAPPKTVGGTQQEAEPQIATPAPAIKRAATPPPTAASDEGAAKAVEPAPAPVKEEQPKVQQAPSKTAIEKPETAAQGYAKELKDHLSEAIKPQTQSLAAPTSPPPTDSAEPESGRVDQLAHWRGLRDSLLAIYPLEETKGVRKGKPTRGGGTAAAGRPDSLIADCLFNLAKSTDSSSEFDQCIRQLTVLEKSSKDPAVGRYLDSARKLKQK